MFSYSWGRSWARIQHRKSLTCALWPEVFHWCHLLVQSCHEMMLRLKVFFFLQWESKNNTRVDYVHDFSPQFVMLVLNNQQLEKPSVQPPDLSTTKTQSMHGEPTCHNNNNNPNNHINQFEINNNNINTYYTMQQWHCEIIQ